MFGNFQRNDVYNVVSYFDRQARTKYPNSPYSQSAERFNRSFDKYAVSPEQNAYYRYRVANAGIPFVSDAFRSSGQYRYWNDYFSNRGLSWADARYPELMSGGGFGSQGIQYLSKNLLRMYK